MLSPAFCRNVAGGLCSWGNLWNNFRWHYNSLSSFSSRTSIFKWLCTALINKLLLGMKSWEIAMKSCRMYLLMIYMNYFVYLVILTYPSYFRQLSPVESPWEKKSCLCLDLTVLRVTVLMLCFLCCLWKQLFLTCSMASLFLAFSEKFILFYCILVSIVFFWCWFWFLQMIFAQQCPPFFECAACTSKILI